MDCNNCNRVVPYIVHEADMARMERTIRRLWTTIIVLIASVICLCVGFFIYESQFEDSTMTKEVYQDVDSDGTAVIAGIGDAIYGYESETASQDNS